MVRVIRPALRQPDRSLYGSGRVLLVPSMLLTSPGDDSASLSIDSMQKSDMAEEPLKIEGDRVQPDQPCEPSLTVIRAEFDVSKPCLGAHNSGNAQSPHQDLRIQKAPTPAIELDGLHALRQAAGSNTPRRARANLLGNSTVAKLAASNATAYTEVNSFAAPLSPLRERDVQALAELFLRDDIYAIEKDVSQRLLTLLPEPCWEDDVFAFLGEFLQVSRQ